MRKKIYAMFLSLCMAMAVAVAQNVPTGLTEAFQNGQAQALSTFLAERVEIVFPDQPQTLGQAKATNALNRFFTNHPPKRFTANHQGKKGESSFLIGTLTTTNGTFRLNIFFRKDNDNYLIHQIRIDKTHE